MCAQLKESAQDALENLIEQFSDVYCFYRELIQNSLDAGTNRIDVYLEYKPSEEESKNGVIIIHVDDYGEGMNRDIIDNQLTRLFSSSKENDLTKIGKFGIGFVSVFAIKPEAVNIDTSKDGEDWRVLFHKDKTFTRMKRDYPVDGTKIKIIKSGNRKFYENFLKRSHETVIFWCKHSEAEIYFQGEPINIPFNVESQLQIHVNESAGEIVSGYTLKNPPFYGFYNKGLTLLEGNKSFFPNITFKVKSKYLEHTLTRDNIREDENYWKAMDLLNDIAKKRLPILLFETMEFELLKSEEETPKYRELLPFTLTYFQNIDMMPRECRERKIARDTEGGFFTVSDILNLANEGCFYFDKRSNPVTRALTRKKKRIIKTQGNSGLFNLLKDISKHFWGKEKIYLASRKFFITEITDSKNLSKAQKELIASVDNINKKMSNKTEPLKFANFDYEDSCIADLVYVMQEVPGELTEVKDLKKKDNLFTSLFSIFSKTRTLILNQNHHYIKGLLELANFDHNMASYLLAKLLYLDDGIDTKIDAQLATISLERSST